MKIYTDKTVIEAAKERIRYLFNEFPNVIVGFSGGKDSVVVYNLCMEVAREQNKLPLKVMFLDQEAEWESTIDLVRSIMYNPEVTPLWYQMPIKLFNSTSSEDNWLYCWEKDAKHIHTQDPISIKDNVYGTQKFHEIFGAIVEKDYPNEPCIYIAGVRAEESPARTIGLTSDATYKHITWGKVLNKAKKHFTFYPLYDWSYTDVWKYIFENNCQYNKIYDFMYQYGIPINKMRVSNVHHETAVDSLFYLQEFEGDTYNKIVDRIQGISTAGKFGKADYFIKELPYMFKDWKDYRDYLIENIITKPEQQKLFRDKFIELDERYKELSNMDYLWKAQINTLLVNDYHFTKLTNWERSPDAQAYRNYHKGKGILKLDKYIKKNGKPTK